MKIAFLGLKGAFDYFQIGGTESFVRRLVSHIAQNGNKVDYILYGDKERRELKCEGVILKYFKTFEESLNAVKEGYDHIVTLYLLPRDRIKYSLFRKRYNKSTLFHFVYFSWPDSLIKRKLYFYEARVFPYNGKLFCISKRQYEYVSKWARNAVYLLPPVPEEYFLKSEEKPINENIKITFLGRVDPGKGINEVIEIFKALKDNHKIDYSIYGIHLPEDKESLQINNWLKNQKDIKYIEVDRQKYSSTVEELVRDVLKETDIFIQPYQKLSSTIDTPLLLLEAMAFLCAVITKPFGNIPHIYGESKFLVHPDNFVADTIQLLKNITYQDLIEERKRIYEQNLKIDFRSKTITSIFLDSLKEL